MKDEKKKKGIVVVIALGGKAPKDPTHTADPDEKKKSDISKRISIPLKDGFTPCPNPYCMAQMRISEPKCPSCGMDNPNSMPSGA